MLRAILGVVVGYIVMVIVVMAGMIGAYLALGEDWAFQPDVYVVSVGWIVVMLVMALVAAVVGGLVCGVVSKHSKNAVLALMGLVLLFGMVGVVGVLLSSDRSAEELARTEPTPVMAAPNKAKQPVWVAIANPIIGAGGVMLGATLVCPNRRTETGE